MTLPRLLIADSHQVFVHALGPLLLDSFLILDAVADGSALLEKAVDLRPDLIIMDMEMPLLNGIEAARQLKQILPRTPIVLLTVHRDGILAIQAFRAGAVGYVLKTSPAEEILRAIRHVLEDGMHLDPELPANLREFVLKGNIRFKTRYSREQLTGCEREVVQLIAEGRATRQIAHLLHLTCKTVEFHKHNAMRKSRTRSVADLTRYAVRNGLRPERCGSARNPGNLPAEFRRNPPQDEGCKTNGIWKKERRTHDDRM